MSLYAQGSNACCQLGIGEDEDSTKKFVEIEGFRNKRVKLMAAGPLHSFAVTVERTEAVEADKIEANTKEVQTEKIKEIGKQKIKEIDRNMTENNKLEEKEIKNNEKIENKLEEEKLIKLEKINTVENIENGQRLLKHKKNKSNRYIETIYSWGVNDEGALGRKGDESIPEHVKLPIKKLPNRRTKNPTPEQLSPTHEIVDISCTNDATFILTKTGDVFGCGTFRASNGVAGFNKTVKNQKEFVKMFSNVKKICCGFNFIVYLDNKKNVYYYGLNEHGEAGIEPFKYRKNKNKKPELIKMTSRQTKKYKNIEDVFIGAYTVFIKTDENIFCFGKNSVGELGLNESNDNTLEKDDDIKFDPLTVKKIKGGDSFTLFLDENNRMYSVGANNFGQLGINSTKNSNKIVFVDDNVKDFDVNSSFIIYQKIGDKKLYGFGCSTMGELGVDGGNCLLKPTVVDRSQVKGEIVDLKVGNDFVVLNCE